jgi:hypothetical protein
LDTGIKLGLDATEGVLTLKGGNWMTQKLGTQTGSLVNHLYSGTAAPVPVVGMGATVLA